MCNACVVEAEFYGEIIPGWYLYRATNDKSDEWPKGHWGLVRLNDPDFVWKPDPSFDPYHGMNDDEINNASPEVHAAYDKWLEQSDEFTSSLACHPEVGYKLVQACKAAGWDEGNSHVGWWLFHRMARIIRAKVME